MPFAVQRHNNPTLHIASQLMNLIKMNKSIYSSSYFNLLYRVKLLDTIYFPPLHRLSQTNMIDKIYIDISFSFKPFLPYLQVQRFSRAGPRGRAREWATLGVHPLSWLLSNNRLEEVCGTLTKGTFSSRLLLSNQDKGCTPSVAHSFPLPLPLPPGFCSTCLVCCPSAAKGLNWQHSQDWVITCIITCPECWYLPIKTIKQLGLGF